MILILANDDPTYSQPQLNWPQAYYSDCGRYKIIVSYLEHSRSSPRFATIAHHPNNCVTVGELECSLLLAAVGIVYANDITDMFEQMFPGEMTPGVRRFIENK